MELPEAGIKCQVQFSTDALAVSLEREACSLFCPSDSFPHGGLPWLSDQGLASCHTTSLSVGSAKVGSWCSGFSVAMRLSKLEGKYLGEERREVLGVRSDLNKTMALSGEL